jgi:hypothetical protein
METMSSAVAVRRAINRAESILPGRVAPEGRPDKRWAAIIRVGEFIESEPEAVWEFARRWGKHAQADLRAAVATCLLEHLLEAHFDALVLRVRREGLASARFAEVLEICWSLGEPNHAEGLERLKREVRWGRSADNTSRG